MKLILRKSIYLALLISPLAWSDQLAGGENADRLISTPDYDEFFGGSGEDTFVIEELGSKPDLILDFEPEKDRLELTPDFLSGMKFETEDFHLDRKGVLSIKLDHRTIPVVDVQLRDLSFEIDQRKGSYLFKFKRKLGSAK